ncbi:MAG: CBS domain-containing protein [Thermoproteota archaeon]|nr:CBS domain-containing protein [Candidatus Brockarchaeota archaeon]MBO3768496.1 CBS domain-containing protein [Candidatus Brockarchaeota archaeon]MBO3802162.1 CBS domain-containing protein [Candidatus Brockarchaeota archaeon]
MEKKVKDVMSYPVISVLSTDPISEAVSKMINHEIGAVLVNAGGRTEGIITERDLIKRVIYEGKDPSKTRCGEIMSKPLITIDPEASITKAISLMKEKGIRRVVVMKDNKTVGIVTEKEIIRSLL